MTDDSPSPPAGIDRGSHLAALHEQWTTPPEFVATAVAQASKAPIRSLRRIVAGEQNEVYEVTFGAAPSLIVRISHRGALAHERERWVLAECAARGIPAPRVYAHQRVHLGDHERSLIVMEKLPGELLCDVDPAGIDVRQVLRELGEWLARFHSIPVRGFGYLRADGAGHRPTLEEWLTASVTDAAPQFEAAGLEVGMDPGTIRLWVREIQAAFHHPLPRVRLIHNDLLANHVLVDEGRLSGVIDFGEVASEPATLDFARWDFNEGDRFPVKWIQEGYGDAAPFDPPDHPVYRALWLATGLWLMQWYHGTGFKPGIEAARDRLLGGPA